MPTSVVTGGAGFLGSHLSDALLERGHRVLCVDNLDTGSLTNIDHLRRDDFVFVQHDLVSHIEIDEQVDFVFHLASPASPIDYLRLPLHTLKVGAYGTHNALGLAKRHRARFLIASTSEVYGDPLVHPQPESYWGNVNPIGPRGVYDEAKRYAEAMTMAYHRQQGVDTAIVRIFNTYGPRMRAHDGRAIPTFVRQALEGKPMTVFGDGSQTRSFTYVSDLIAGIVALAESSEHEPVNIGNPDRVHAARARPRGAQGHRVELGDRVRGIAGQRSTTTTPRYFACTGGTWMGTPRRARRGAEALARTSPGARMRFAASPRSSAGTGAGARQMSAASAGKGAASASRTSAMRAGVARRAR